MSEYLAQFQNDPSLIDNIKTNQKDFLPYADLPGDWWTGFYS